jgi:hypothetical protein
LSFLQSYRVILFPIFVSVDLRARTRLLLCSLYCIHLLILLLYSHASCSCLLAVCTTDSRVKLYRAPFCDYTPEWVEVGFPLLDTCVLSWCNLGKSHKLSSGVGSKGTENSGCALHVTFVPAVRVSLIVHFGQSAGWGRNGTYVFLLR